MFRWHEAIDVEEYPDADGGAYELLYSFGFDTREEANAFAFLLETSPEFDALVNRLAEEV